MLIPELNTWYALHFQQVDYRVEYHIGFFLSFLGGPLTASIYSVCL